MATQLGMDYIVAMTVLFFFWAYGIARFAMDVKNVYVPKTKQYLRGRRRRKAEKEREEEREELEDQLL